VTALYEASGLGFEYPLGNLSVSALRSVDLTVDLGEFVCLAGPSGSGKSTLLHLLGLIESPQLGSLRFQGDDVADFHEAARNQIRRFKLGFIFQQFHLLPVLTALENVEYFLTRQRLPRHERMARSRSALEEVGLWDKRRHRPDELSGGERQRVAIARAIAKRPQVIIADEPTASLDQETGRQVMAILGALNREHGVTLVLASHDPMVHESAGRLARLSDGAIVADSGSWAGSAMGT
jgi:ABC-type lipoprotein export system ATPase subunit